MTNQQKFIDTFGQFSFDALMSNCDNIDILKWFMKEYDYYNTTQVEDIPTVPLSEAFAPEKAPKKRGGGKPGRKTYDSRWYEDVVEDFYLGSERTKNFTLSDDPSLKPVKSVDGLKCRFIDAVKALGIEDCVSVHKYYSGTVNECVVLENIRNPKSFIGSYKLS